MADVSRAQDRGQLILVSGLTIAVTMLVLVLLLNTTIYTENVATRGIDSDVGDAADIQRTVDEEVEAILSTESAGNWSDVNESVRSAFDLLATQQRNASLERGQRVEASIRDMTRGAKVNNSLESGNATGLEKPLVANVTVEGSWGDERLNLTSDRGDIQVNETGSGFELLDGAGNQLCGGQVFGDGSTIDLLNESVHDSGAVSDCSGGLWGGDSSFGDLDVTLNESVVNGTLDFAGAGDNINLSEVGSPTWFVHDMTVDLTFVSADLRYETTRSIVGEVPS